MIWNTRKSARNEVPSKKSKTHGQGNYNHKKLWALRAEPDAELFTNISSNWEMKGRQKNFSQITKIQLNGGIKCKNGLKFSHSILKQISSALSAN
jgi:hypothetical protein